MAQVQHVEVPEPQKLMRFIRRRGFEHHAAMNASRSAAVLAEAMENYLGWDVYVHGEGGIEVRTSRLA